MYRRLRSTARGFTLIELLVVMGILAILMGFIVPALKGVTDGVRNARAVALLNGISNALDAYKQTFYMYPPDRATGTHPALDKSAECVVYYLSGPAIAYGPGAPPPGFGWTHVVFKDPSPGGTARRAGPIFYTFKLNELADLDGDTIPELVDPWGHRVIYNAGGTTNGPFNQFGAPVHNLRTFDVFCAGRDGRFRTPDDVQNWKDLLTDGYGSLMTDVN